jgi:hypothetical protein
VTDHARAVIHPEWVRIEPFGSRVPNRVAAMVERLIFLGSATQAILRLAAGTQLQALVQNDGAPGELTQGNPGARVLAPDALLGGSSGQVTAAQERPLAVT